MPKAIMISIKNTRVMETGTKSNSLLPILKSLIKYYVVDAWALDRLPQTEEAVPW